MSRKVNKRSIQINFNGGDVSGIDGVELLRAADDRLGLYKAACRLLPDPRDRTSTNDTALQSAVGVLKTMGSASTLCRMEAVVGQVPTSKSRKMVFQMHELILNKFIESHDKPPKSLVLDLMAPIIESMSNRKADANSSHHGGYAFLTWYVYCGNHRLISYLRPVNRTD